MRVADRQVKEDVIRAFEALDPKKSIDYNMKFAKVIFESKIYGYLPEIIRVTPKNKERYRLLISIATELDWGN